MAKSSLSSLIDKLEELLDSGTKVPIFGKVLLDREELYEVVDKMRVALPEALKDAEKIAMERDRWIAEAKEEARKRIENAEAQVAKMIRDSEIQKQAESEAQRIINEAKQMAKEMRAGACDYADTTLNNLEQDMEKVLRMVRKGRDELKRRGA